MRSSIAFFLLLGLVAPSYIGGNVKEPKSPKVPTVVKDKDKKTVYIDPLKNMKQGNLLPAYVMLESGQKVAGKILVKYPFFQITHVVNGFTYHKKIYFSQIRLLRIQKWKAVRSGGSYRNKRYYFMPSVYKIETYDGTIVTLRKRLKLLDSFDISNRNGTTRLYSYFVDYWNGKWRNSGQSQFSYNVEHPHKRAVRAISFLREKKGSTMIFK